MIRVILITTIIYVLFTSGAAGDVNFVTGIPSIQNYSPHAYKQHEQNWSAVQDCTGIMYFGNSHGLLEYDGINWGFISTTSPEVVRSVAVSKNNEIFVGGYNYFGSLIVGSAGQHRYQSLSEVLPPENLTFSNVWHINIASHGIYFQTDSSLFRWKDGGFTSWKTAYPMNRSFLIRDTLYLTTENMGLSYLHDDELIQVRGGERFRDEKIYAMIPFGNNSILIGTRNQGLFVRTNGVVIPFASELGGFCRNAKLTALAMLSDGSVVLGSINDGLAVMNPDGMLIRKMNKDSGLADNTVWNMFVDNQSGLWLCLNNGISRVSIPSPISYFNKGSGIEGTVESIVCHQGILYVATPLGLYFIDQASESPVMKTVPDFQPYKLVEGPKSLLASGYISGIHELRNGRMYRISDYGGMCFLQSQIDSNRIYVGLEDGLASLCYRENRWINEGKITLDMPPVWEIVETDEGILWLRSNTAKICRIHFPEGIFSPNKAEIGYFEDGHGLTPTKQNYVFAFEGGVRIGNNNRLLKYNPDKNQFVRDNQLQSILPDTTSSVLSLVKDQNGNLWMFTNGRKGLKIGIAFRRDDGTFEWNPAVSSRLSGTFFYSIYPDPDHRNIVWLGGPDGLIRFDSRVKREYHVRYSCLIRSVTMQQDSLLWNRGNPVSHPELDIFENAPLAYRYNGLRFEFAAPFYESGESNHYQYKLEGFDDKWSEWSEETRATYTNIPEGRYQFRVRAINLFGDLSEEGVYRFEISPPWYRSVWAYALYLLLVIGGLYLLLKFRSRQLEKEKQVLAHIVNERTAEIQIKNKQLAEQAEKLKELDHIKSRFFANISHEFRTPLTLIIGPVEEMLYDIFSGDPKQIYKVILRNAKRLLRLINQLLDLSRLESGKMFLQASSQPLAPLLRAIMYSFSSLAENKHIQLQYIDATQDMEIWFDRDKLEKIMYNLISNAFKFTPKHGVITVELNHFKQDEATYPEGAIQISIHDTGIGISSQDLPFVFNRFTQGAQPGGHHQGGSGIGLALVKELVSLHHGEISVKSAPGIGTEFDVVLPKGKAHLRPEEMVDSPDIGDETGELLDLELAGLPLNHADTDSGPPPVVTEETQILVVEDNADVRTYICGHFLGKCKLLEAENGRQGIEMARDQLPDLIISDVMMPEADGIELCNTLKNDPLTNHIPIILLTAKASDEAKIEGLETGADAYLTKPFNARELSVRVKILIEGRRKLREKFIKEFLSQPADVQPISFEDGFLRKVHDRIEENMTDPEFSAENLHITLSLSRRQFHRKIQALTDQTPGQLIRTMRLKRAMQLINGKAGSISEIAFQVGFNNLSYFSKCFSEQFGKLPSEV